MTEALIGLASVAAMQGDFVAARDLYQESFTVLQRIHYQELIAPCLEGLATVTAAQDELGWALHLWGAADALRVAMGTPMPPVHRLEYPLCAAIVAMQSDSGSPSAAGGL